MTRLFHDHLLACSVTLADDVQSFFQDDLVPGTDDLTVEAGIIAVELVTSAIADDGAVVHVVAAATLGTMELLAIVLPREGVTSAAELTETVGALALIGDKDIVVAAGANDNTVVCTKDTALLVLTVGGEWNILYGTIIVAGGLDMTDTLVQTGLYLTEMTRVANDARQLTRLWMKLCVEEKITPILTVYGILSIA